jgi:hypothetical protein
VQHAFHRVRRSGYCRAKTRLRTEGKISNSVLDAIRGCGAPPVLQLDFGGLNRTLESVIAASDDLSICKLPADARVFEVVVNVSLEWIGLKFFVWVAELRVVKVELAEQVLYEVIDSESLAS